MTSEGARGAWKPMVGERARTRCSVASVADASSSDTLYGQTDRQQSK